VCYFCAEDSECPAVSCFQSRPSTVTVEGRGSSETSVNLCCVILYFVISQNNRQIILKIKVKFVKVFNPYLCTAQGTGMCVFRNDIFRTVECFWRLC